MAGLVPAIHVFLAARLVKPRRVGKGALCAVPASCWQCWARRRFAHSRDRAALPSLRNKMDTFAAGETRRLLAMTQRGRLCMMISVTVAFVAGPAYFIGQMASATAACGGKMVTNLPPTYCNSTGSASLFWPFSSNLTRFQGMMV